MLPLFDSNFGTNWCLEHVYKCASRMSPPDLKDVDLQQPRIRSFQGHFIWSFQGHINLVAKVVQMVPPTMNIPNER